jgi:hypothetical protein
MNHDYDVDVDVLKLPFVITTDLITVPKLYTASLDHDFSRLQLHTNQPIE